ncbi:hypothetical protein [Xanthobacter agilis]|uniref:SRSO17 transposase n=1 Tax=Xanthobacter agilis TaxID=47492 RepID=A0ABU0LFU7_XANAG|nr:hypothetical protein [Xanthobacter agilis]MDQ0505978.1 SRSO17 transposase [Xanthobacter agilis]
MKEAIIAAGLYCGWRVASTVVGPLEFRRTERVTTQTYTYHCDADHDGDAA